MRTTALAVRGADDRAFLATSALCFVASAGGTIVWCGSMDAGMPMPGGWTMSMAWMRMPGQTWPAAAATFMGMWVLMMVAMMLPSLVPMLARYRRGVGGSDALTSVAAAGYFVVWTLVGACAYPTGIALGAAAMRSDSVAHAVPVATGVVLVAAGLVQLTTWKAAQLVRCRSEPCDDVPAPDVRSAWRYGCRFGLHCARCCSAWMAVLLVTGVMDVGVMAVVAAGITAERWAARPRRIARAGGMLLIAAGVVAIARSLSRT